MQFLKKHYEKIILCIVLLALAVAAVMLSIRVSAVKRSLDKAGKTIESYPEVPLKAVDLTVFQNSLTVHTNPSPVAMTNRHLLFNPVRWYKNPDGSIIGAFIRVNEPAHERPFSFLRFKAALD